jgi:hypothetical protein
MAQRPKYTVENFYDHIKKEDHKHRHYDNEDAVNIQLPARILLCGPSGQGKTNIILNIMKAVNKWHHVILVAKNLDEPLYAHVIEKYRALEKKHKVNMLLAITDLKDLPDIDKDFPEKPTENTLVIFDDLICESAKDLKLLDPWFTRGRKKEVTMAFLSQGFFDIPKLIRKNCNYVILKKISNPKDLGRILKEYSLDCTLPEMRQMYDYAMRGDPHLSFFMIDMATKKQELKYRANFDPIC